MVCTFFGHRDAPSEIKQSLGEAIVKLIEVNNVDVFYVGNNGHFDRMVREILREFKKIYSINYYVALAYIPKKDEYEDYSDTVFFDELSTVPSRFRIIARNKIMLKRSDYVVTYVKYIGNARNFKELAEKQGKILINLE